MYIPRVCRAGGVWYRLTAIYLRVNVCIILPAGGTGARHIAAVEHLILSETKSACIEKDNKGVVIDTPVRECPQCRDKKFVCNGWYAGKSGKKQRYKCQECSRRFRDNPGFKHRHTSYIYIILCPLLHETGMPAARLPHILSHMGITVSANTITRWPEHYTCMVETYTDSIYLPNLGNRLSADEKRQDIGGRERCTATAKDMVTKFILAWEVSPIKIRHDATNLLRRALNRAGKTLPNIHD